MHEGVQVSSKLEQLQALLAPVVEALGYQCWGIEFLSQGRHSLLRIYIDKEGGVLVEDCEIVSRQVSGVLDVEDPISAEYTLEVSSPGMDRPLFTLEQFALHAGEQVKIKLRSPFDGRRNFQGLLRGVEEQDVVVHVEDHEYLLPIDLIDKANIIPTFD
ncbi:ribosome maturation factor RimP [Pseudomonas cichorii]|nr:ribosome maturation factor RimP [Pseudomonas cichorii]GFM63338.1 ribosome maturation factor RimP [Pseudomonas cichorii]GFM67805.1 ribosome maturation factor RimP [Pseudomonas cichorii]GFM83276.1 ribosome maturation factor RimP [Pseudomonas cichorii]GFM89800.1 ribosome maturation factor RimP [Pseudomonas cichorii]